MHDAPLLLLSYLFGSFCGHTRSVAPLIEYRWVEGDIFQKAPLSQSTTTTTNKTRSWVVVRYTEYSYRTRILDLVHIYIYIYRYYYYYYYYYYCYGSVVLAVYETRDNNNNNNTRVYTSPPFFGRHTLDRRTVIALYRLDIYI